MKILLFEAELLRADRQTYMGKLKVSFHKFKKASKQENRPSELQRHLREMCDEWQKSEVGE